MAVTHPRIRQDNRRQALLDAAAAIFRARGFHASSMRDIARAAGMLPGSVYYHFDSKEALLAAVYGEGVHRICTAVDAAVAREQHANARLRAACRAHLQVLLDASDYAQVVIRVLPEDVPAAAADLGAHRDGYERRFRDLIGALDLPAEVDRGHLRRLLLGGLNWARHWYQPGRDTPARIADAMLACLRIAGMNPQEYP
jgi:AcrR family transcriptional regulator